MYFSIGLQTVSPLNAHTCMDLAKWQGSMLAQCSLNARSMLGFSNSRVCRDTDSIIKGWHGYFMTCMTKTIVPTLINNLKKGFHQRELHFIFMELPLTRSNLIPVFLLSLLNALLNLLSVTLPLGMIRSPTNTSCMVSP